MIWEGEGSTYVDEAQCRLSISDQGVVDEGENGADQRRGHGCAGDGAEGVVPVRPISKH